MEKWRKEREIEKKKEQESAEAISGLKIWSKVSEPNLQSKIPNFGVADATHATPLASSLLIQYYLLIYNLQIYYLYKDFKKSHSIHGLAMIFCFLIRLMLSVFHVYKPGKFLGLRSTLANFSWANNGQAKLPTLTYKQFLC